MAKRKHSARRRSKHQTTHSIPTNIFPSDTLIRLTLYACILFSGAAGLIYEVVWARQLTLFLGTTAHSHTAVLTAFMTGLAAGSYLIGRFADRSSKPLVFYAWLEILVGLYGLSTPWLFEMMQSQYTSLVGVAGIHGLQGQLLRFSLALVAMLIPTFLMGGTLPLLVRGLTPTLKELSRSTARLYGLNTLGATAGAFVAGYLFLPSLGVQNTILLTVLFNLLVGIVVLTLRKRLANLLVDPDISIVEKIKGPLLSQSGRRILLVGFAISGFAALVYQVVWIRALVLVIGSSVYAFSTTLTTFLAGIALGSLAYSAWAKNQDTDTRVRLAAFLQLGISLSAVIGLALIGKLPEIFLKGYQAGLHENFMTFQGFIFLLCFLIMLWPTLMMGALFPLVTSLWTRSADRMGSGVGTAYAANALGTILGAFLGGIFLMSVLGIQGSLYLAAGLSAAVAGMFWWLRPAPSSIASRYGWPALVVVLLGVLVLLMPKWDRMIMQSGVFSNPDRFSRVQGDLHKGLESRKTLYYGEGIDSIVSVFESVHEMSLNISDGSDQLELNLDFLLKMIGAETESERVLVINGKTDASSKGDLPTQILFGQLPMFLHPNPEKVLVIGLGSGITAGSVATHDSLQKMDILEISPQVVEASQFFLPENGDVLSDPRVHHEVADARNFLMARQDGYDVIISEPSNPWISGISNLFTEDFFRLASQQLHDNGIMTQWFHTYNMALDDVRTIIKTFQEVFPNVTLWQPMAGDLLMIGSRHPHQMDFARTGQLLGKERVRENLQKVKMDSIKSIVHTLLMRNTELTEFTAGAVLNTDDRPRIEFNAPRNLYSNSTLENSRAITQHIDSRRIPAPIRGLLSLDGNTVHASYINLRIANSSELALDRFDAKWLTGHIMLDQDKNKGMRQSFDIGQITWQEADSHIKASAWNWAKKQKPAVTQQVLSQVMDGGITEEGELILPGAHTASWAVGPGLEVGQILLAIGWQCPVEHADKRMMQYTVTQLTTDPGRHQWIDQVKELGERLQCDLDSGKTPF